MSRQVKYSLRQFDQPTVLNLCFILKTKGFLPEEIYLKKHIGFRLGVSFGFDK